MQVTLVDGPFSQLDGLWRFVPLPVPGAAAHPGTADACKIEFDMRYAFANGLLDAAISPVFDRIAGTFVDSFVRRAEQVYGAALAARRSLHVAVAWSARPGEALRGRRRAARRRDACSTRSAPAARCRATRAVDISTQAVGIWGRTAALDAPLAEGDRVEIYRPLRDGSEGGAAASRRAPEVDEPSAPPLLRAVGGDHVLGVLGLVGALLVVEDTRARPSRWCA